MAGRLGGRPRLLVIGHGRHGKDTVAALLSELFQLSVISSSEFAARKAVFPLVADLYDDWRAAYADRHAHRALWFHAIRAYNLRPGPSLAEQILAVHHVYTGMRSRAEFEASRNLFNLVIWVDASERVPPEPDSSMELTAADADLVIDNNRDLEAVEAQLWAYVLEDGDGRVAADLHLGAAVSPAGDPA